MVEDCIFCEIVDDKIPCHKIWEDESHLAFLSIFPNTKGFAVVITKEHHESYLFDLSDEIVSNIVLAAKKVGKLLDEKFEDVGRTGMIFEGFGVNHIHAKLFPMHGTANMSTWKPTASANKKFFQQYEGYISSHDCDRADDEDLRKLAEKLRD